MGDVGGQVLDSANRRIVVGIVHGQQRAADLVCSLAQPTAAARLIIGLAGQPRNIDAKRPGDGTDECRAGRCVPGLDLGEQTQGDRGL